MWYGMEIEMRCEWYETCFGVSDGGCCGELMDGRDLCICLDKVAVVEELCC